MRVKHSDGALVSDGLRSPADTPVRKMLDELAPGERRDHKRTIEPTGREGRFWDVAMDGGVSLGSLIWVNNKLHPSVMDGEQPFVSMNELAPPVLHASDEDTAIGDFYRVTTNLFIFSNSIVECIQDLDPRSIQLREATVEGVPVSQKYWLALIARRLDAVDAERTNCTLEHRRILPNREFYSKLVYYQNGLVIRDDVSSDVHCFADVYSGKLFFSTSLVSCTRSNGARFYARHPTGLSDFPEAT
jgi:hypothetical protein